MTGPLPVHLIDQLTARIRDEAADDTKPQIRYAFECVAICQEEVADALDQHIERGCTLEEAAEFVRMFVGVWRQLAEALP